MKEDGIKPVLLDLTKEDSMIQCVQSVLFTYLVITIEIEYNEHYKNLTGEIDRAESEGCFLSKGEEDGD